MIEERVRKIVQSHVKIADAIDEIVIEDNLIEMGIDSITFIKMVVALEAEFGVEFNEGVLDIKQYPTIQSLVSYLEAL